jgi:hypothetical protein
MQRPAIFTSGSQRRIEQRAISVATISAAAKARNVRVRLLIRAPYPMLVSM